MGLVKILPYSSVIDGVERAELIGKAIEKGEERYRQRVVTT